MASTQEVGHCDLILLLIFFILIILKIKVQLMFDSKFQPTILSGSGGKVDFTGLAILSNSGHVDSRPA